MQAAKIRDMPLLAFWLLLVSALLHAGWNVQAKRRQLGLSEVFWASLSVSLLLLPCAAIWPTVTLDLLAMWPWLLATGACQCVYFLALLQAYRLGEVSVAYPMMRALPILLTAGMVMLLQREGWQDTPLLAMVVISLGCLLLCARGANGKLSWAGIGWAVLAACGICGYHWIDDYCLRQLAQDHHGPGFTLVYVMAQCLAISLCYMLYAGLSRTPLRRRPQAHDAIIGGVVYCSYGLVLFVMPLCDNVAWAVAFRQLSIPIAAGIGMVALKENLSRRKLAAIACICLGLTWAGLAS